MRRLHRPTPRPGLRSLLLLCGTLLVLAGCDRDEPGASSTSKDVTKQAQTTVDAVQVDSDLQDSCPPPPVAVGVARARKLACQADLPVGQLATARVGDIVLENAKARFVVRTGPAGYAISGMVGGSLVDAVRVGKDGKQQGVDGLQEWASIVALHLIKAEKVSIVGDGADGVARVQVSGKLVPFPTVHAFLPMATPSVTAVHEYVLKADSASLELRTTVTPTNGKPDTSLVADATFWSGEHILYRPGGGAPDSGVSPPTKARTLGLSTMHFNPLLVDYALSFPSEISIIDISGVQAFVYPAAEIPVEGRTFVRHFVVGDGQGGLASALAAAGKISGEEQGVVTGKVDGMWPGVEISFLDKNNGPLTRCRPAADGTFACPVPTAAVGVRPLWLGNGEGQAGGKAQQAAVITKISVTKQGRSDVQLVAPKPARLHVRVTGENGDKPAFQMRAQATGEAASAGGRVFIDGDGDATYLLPPGTWKLWLYRGPEHSAELRNVTLKAGETTEVQAKLVRVVDSSGWVACDMHIHAEHSTDSEVPNRERLLDAIAVGLDYAVATDHDHLTDYRPWLKAAGLQDRLTVASGVEISTAKFGHQAVWPLTPQPGASGNGAPMWHEKDAEQLLQTLRGGDPKRVVQINHPRGSQSYFEGIGFDAKTTDAKLLSFDAIELLNGKRIDDTNKVLIDWFGLLDRGLRPTATGTSDTHTLHSGVGNARTMVWLGKDNAGAWRDVQGKFTGPEVDAAIKAGRAVATTGPLLTLTLEQSGQSAMIGETLASLAEPVTATVTVQAPEWMPLGTVELFRNGELVHSLKVTDTPVEGGRRMAKVSFAAAPAKKAGWWMALHKPGAAGDGLLVYRPVWAIANPVYEEAVK